MMLQQRPHHPTATAFPHYPSRCTIFKSSLLDVDFDYDYDIWFSYWSVLAPPVAF
ncbi:hypothetical protein EUBSIR_00015 [[Eubacterium] siraeum DSM 15702]|uniref:Uncharacterized protein n=1 Tax=[Eubacterium] siraeum DSM 15702 TaxID=428128 RepID=B0MJP0_9FIRM|nr:hypothetical protein EUBSIR_00015 [[Eubacterium] siraeum DSM 15702]